LIIEKRNLNFVAYHQATFRLPPVVRWLGLQWCKLCASVGTATVQTVHCFLDCSCPILLIILCPYALGYYLCLWRFKSQMPP